DAIAHRNHNVFFNQNNHRCVLSPFHHVQTTHTCVHISFPQPCQSRKRTSSLSPTSCSCFCLPCVSSPLSEIPVREHPGGLVLTSPALSLSIVLREYGSARFDESTPGRLSRDGDEWRHHRSAEKRAPPCLVCSGRSISHSRP